jgi:hypothetical protein
LYLAADQGAVANADFTHAYASAERVKSLCSALVRRLASRPPRGGPKRDVVGEAAAPWIIKQPRVLESGQHPAFIRVGSSASHYIHTRKVPYTATSARPHVRTSARPHVHTSTRARAGD